MVFNLTQTKKATNKMAIKIIKTSEMTVENVVVTIYGSPSSGKTSLAFTAKNPLMLDFDNGVHRAYGLTGNEPIVKCKAWQDVDGITKADLEGFDTLIVDTVGSMTAAIQTYAEQKGKKGMQLFGEVGNIYKSFVNKIKSWGKDVVFIAHFTEEKKGEEIITRLDAVGNIAKNNVYQSSDLLGYLCLNNGVRLLDFNPIDGKIGKNTGNFAQIDLTKSAVTLSDIIEQLKIKMNATAIEAQERNRVYNETIEIIDKAETVEQFNELMNNEVIVNDKQGALKVRLVNVAKNKGIEFDKTKKCFVEAVNNEQPTA